MIKAADLGSKAASWQIYQDFSEYQYLLNNDERARYRYLLRAADMGNNDAQFALAQQLRAGHVEVGDDGVLRPVDTAPLQESLNYAKHLLERAAQEDHKQAKKMLSNAKESDWDAKTAKRLAVAKDVAKPIEEPAKKLGFRSYFSLILFIIAIVRACSHHSASTATGCNSGMRDMLSYD